MEEQRRLSGASDARQELQAQVKRVQVQNGELKVEYDSLLEGQRAAETKLREEAVRGEQLLADIMRWKNQAAARMNSRNERRSRYLNAPLTPGWEGGAVWVRTEVFLSLSELERQTCSL